MLDLRDKLRHTKNRLRANASYQSRRAKATTKYEVRLRSEARAAAYTTAARMIERAIQ